MKVELIPYEVEQFKRLSELAGKKIVAYNMAELQNAYIELAASSKSAANVILRKIGNGEPNE